MLLNVGMAMYLYAGLRCGESGYYLVQGQELLVEAISHASYCWWSPISELFNAVMIVCASLVLFAHAGHLVQSGKHNSSSLVAFLLHLSLVEGELLPLLQAAAQPLHVQPHHPASRLPLRNIAATTEQTRFLKDTKLRPTGSFYGLTRPLCFVAEHHCLMQFTCHLIE